MKNLFILFILSSVIVVASKRSFATHAAGADISYEWVGGNNYFVVCSFYRDCMGINAPLDLPLDVTSQSCSYQQTFTMELDYSSQGMSILNYCSTAQSTCDGGSLTGYEVYHYTAMIVLPFNCSDWILGTYISARNDAIS